MKTIQLSDDVTIQQTSARKWDILVRGQVVFRTHLGEKSARKEGMRRVYSQMMWDFHPGDRVTNRTDGRSLNNPDAKVIPAGTERGTILERSYHMPYNFLVRWDGDEGPRAENGRLAHVNALQKIEEV